MDVVIIVLFAAALFGLALVGSKAHSMYSVWRKSRTFGLNPTIHETLALTKFYYLEDSFLKACARFKSLDTTISLTDIVRHHMADGDTFVLLDKWHQLSKDQTRTISFKSAILYDLSGKDLNQIQNEQSKVYDIKLDDIKENHISIQYACQFRIDHESTGWVTPDIEHYKEIIKDKITLAVLSGDISNLDLLFDFIKSQYLNEQFWKQLCHGIVISQELKTGKL